MRSAFDVDEAVNRQMDRLMATARYGRQQKLGEPYTEIVVEGAHGEVSIGFGPDDIQAVMDELAAGAPCGICRCNPCSWRVPDGDA